MNHSTPLGIRAEIEKEKDQELKRRIDRISSKPAVERFMKVNSTSYNRPIHEILVPYGENR